MLPETVHPPMLPQIDMKEALDAALGAATASLGSIDAEAADLATIKTNSDFLKSIAEAEDTQVTASYTGADDTRHNERTETLLEAIDAKLAKLVEKPGVTFTPSGIRA